MCAEIIVNLIHRRRRQQQQQQPPTPTPSPLRTFA
jgi:hypothetical protein